MIEVMYNENEQEENREQPDLRSLKNIRQIGTTNGKGRLYVEDRVKSYIDQYRNAETPHVLVLLGKERRQDGVCFFIDGAMVLEQAEIMGSEIKMPDLLEKLLWDECEIHFPHSRVLGFCLPSYSHVLDLVTRWDHQPTVFLTQDENEEEIFYIWEHSRFMPQSGYYIYYEENQAMKEYAEAHPCPVARSTRQRRRTWDRKAEAAENAREDNETEEQKGTFFSSINGFLYVASAAMVIVVLVVGITLMSNYEKMYQLQQSMDTIVQAVSGDNVVTRTESPASETPSSKPAGTSLPSPEPTDMTTVSARDIDMISPSEREPVGDHLAGDYDIYTVQEGDTLSSICRDRYSSEQAVEQIRMLNDLKSENELQVGEKILLP